MRALSAASVALVAATLALVVSPAAATLLHPAQQRHTDLRRGVSRPRDDNQHHRSAADTNLKSTGNVTMQWVFNATSLWEANLGVFNVRHSDVQPGQVLGYAATPGDLATPSGFIFALNATSGAVLWHARLTQVGPTQCSVGFVETATTVACLGPAEFAIASRATGTLVANGQYAAGFEVPMLGQFPAATPQAERQARHDDVVALALSNSAGWTTGKGVALNLTSGVVTPMGEVTTSAGRMLNAPFVGALRGGGEQHLELTVTWWAASLNASATCNDVFTVTYSTTGNATLVARLPASFSNGPASNGGSYCPQPALFAYPDDDVIFGVVPDPGNVSQAYHLNGTFRYAMQLPLPPYDTLLLLKPLAGPRRDAVLFESFDQLASLTSSNATVWADQSWVFGGASIVEIDETSLTIGGCGVGMLVNVSLATGFAQWGLTLPGGAGGRNLHQVTSRVDVFMNVFSIFTFVRKSDGASVASFNTGNLWKETPWAMQFQQREGAAAGTGTVLVSGTGGSVMSVAVTAEP